MDWVAYNRELWHKQPLPKERKYVLVKVAERDDNFMRLPVTLAVGYLKYAAGDRYSPVFIVPGVGGPVVAWSDSLPADFEWPKNE
jgi:hypothetical protein